MHADRYVKAFYLQTEEDLLEWMKVNKVGLFLLVVFSSHLHASCLLISIVEL